MIEQSLLSCHSIESMKSFELWQWDEPRKFVDFQFHAAAFANVEINHREKAGSLVDPTYGSKSPNIFD